MLLLRKSLTICNRHARTQYSKLLSSTSINLTTTTNTNNTSSDDPTNFPGAQAPFIQKPTITFPNYSESIPIYRVLNRYGEITDASQDPGLNNEFVQKMYRDMVTLKVMDKILYESQRQGRISFYMQNSGEEATHIGSAAGLSNNDLIYGQYREAGVLVWRGFTIADFVNQCYGNSDDLGKGRQMPVHYGSKKLNFVTISSPLGTQIPQAVGAAYALKLRPNNDQCVVTYFGEGAASEGDAHAAFNFAATLDCPIILFCRNNGYAISTASTEQYKGDGIAGRARGYGIPAIRVDGTDAFAVYNATKLAREYVLKNNKPIIFEAMTMRVGHHSTSDDSSAYRSNDVLEVWNTIEHPIIKLKLYMQNRGWFNETEEDNFEKDVRKKVLAQISSSEKTLKANWREMFYDVYHDVPQHLKQQMASMEKHIEAHKQHYPLNQFQSGK